MFNMMSGSDNTVESARKRNKQDDSEINDLITKGTQRDRALAICLQHPVGSIVVPALFSHARPSLLASNGLPLLRETNLDNAARGAFLLLRRKWNARRQGLAQDFLEFAARMLESQVSSLENKWYALVAAFQALKLDESEASSLLNSLGYLAWYRQPSDAEQVRRKLIENAVIGETLRLESDPNHHVVNVHGILLPMNALGQEVSSYSQVADVSLHPDTAKANLRALAISICTSPEYGPIVLKGTAGSGKTWSIRTLARMCNKELIELQLDDQVDSKTLLGSMTCVRGTFAWMPGALTRAIHEGKWVLVEDIDSCPAEVVSSLKPLFETGCVNLPNRSNSFELEAASGFKFFGTTRKMDYQFHRLGTDVVIESLSKEELAWVCKHRYFEIPDHIVDMVVDNHLAMYQVDATFSPSQKIRDLFKWFDRIIAFCSDILVRSRSISTNTFITEKARTSLVLEGIDVITSRMVSPSTRISCARNLAVRWGLIPDCGSNLVESRRPEFVFDSETKIWRAGRVLLGFQRNCIPKEYQESFAPTSISLKTLEQISTCVFLNEPCLLVGETGAGKTSMVQLLAKCCGKTLVVQNMHVQSDSTEFLGGFKPAPSLRLEANELHTEFLLFFESCFDAKENNKFLDAVLTYCEEGKWKKFCKALETACAKYATDMKDSAESDITDGQKAKKKARLEGKSESWSRLYQKIETFKIRTQNKDLFTFVEGVLIRALRNGDWILLDEVNLASGETLERLLPLLEDSSSSLSLTERGDVEKIPRHREFRLFAAMNPSTDFGKKNLPPALRSRFTEIYVDEVVEESDIRLVVEKFLGQDARDLVEPTVSTFVRARELAKSTLVDGNGQAPRFSLRTLVRSLQAARSLATTQRFGMKRALYESFNALFTTSLEPKSCSLLNQEILKRILSGDRIPSGSASKSVNKKEKILVCNDSYWLDLGKDEIVEDVKFVSTPHVEAKLKLLARAVALKRYPILLQGPTSAGKTSLIAHLAKMTGNRFVRINNHEHTDLEEYLGSYVADDTGKLVFHYGSLVEAVKKGYWIVLDELNLAPSDVLEALNRLLDDNRELFLTETQETIVPHPNFILFATQNPPGGAYGGRKQLSKAFRNRFLEIHLDDIPHAELETILEKRNLLPESFSKAMVNVMKELQFLRSKSHLFAGKAGLITPRDLMRWADRDPRTYQELAEEGYRLLGERLRSAEERSEVQQVLERFCRAKINFAEMYRVPDVVKDDLVWTESMKRLFSLVHACALKKEPCLIVGETGLGKTRCVQAVAKSFSTELVVLNLHQNTETADILGSLRPVRFRSEIVAKLQELQKEHRASSVQDLLDSPLVPPEAKEEIASLIGKSLRLFEWADGPLVQCMRTGEFFLLDEISLAEDAVLERLNSVLETGRTLTLAERGGQVVEVIKAHDSFRAFATMNPGGDFGKRELSPALRNRFTEIWLPSITDFEDFRLVIQQVFAKHEVGSSTAHSLTEQMVQFTKWFNRKCEQAHQSFAPLSMRDLIAWTEFICETLSAGSNTIEHSEDYQKQMFAHGCFLTCLDGLGVGSGLGSLESKQQFLRECRQAFPDVFVYEQGAKNSNGSNVLVNEPDRFGVPPFLIAKGSNIIGEDEVVEKQTQAMALSSEGSFEFNAPTTRLNLVRLLRAMQLQRAILLEGSPGVGKTSIVSALAKAIGKKLVRINLSEQTDFSDLIGSDLPTPSTSAEDGASTKRQVMEFQWSDGVFLQALRAGDWVLLDELNLASQSVLEGLNSVLDHRASVFVPELNRSFPCNPHFRVFACQNPLQQGGGRKGLPKSFLNRFTKVFVEALDENDFIQISAKVYPSLVENDQLKRIIVLTEHMRRLSSEVSSSSTSGGAGGEFNLRDVFRFCEMTKGYSNNHKVVFDLLYSSRYGLDMKKCESIFNSVFPPEQFCEKTSSSSSQSLFDWYRVKSVTNEKEENPNGNYVMFGGEECVLKRVPFANTSSTSSSSSDMFSIASFPSSLTPMLVRVAQCVKHSFPVLLIGDSGSGKTLTLSELSSLLGHPLQTFQMTSGTDSTELLGCFEQIDFNQNKIELLRELEIRMRREIEQITLVPSLWQAGESALVMRYLAKLEGCCASLHQVAQNLLAGGTNFTAEHIDQIFANSLDLLEGRVEGLRQPVREKLLVNAVTFSSEILAPKEDDVRLFTDRLRQQWDADNKMLQTITTADKDGGGGGGGGFRWVDGALIRAIEKGEWIVLEDANLCSPTVLDRLNSLLEPNGELMVNEQGTTLEGGLRVCKPHENFRIFLTINPKFGLVSRAMRNRCVELYLNPEQYRPSERDRSICLQEDFGIRPDSVTIVGSEVDLLVQAKKATVEAEMGLVPLQSVWTTEDAYRRLPVGLSWSRDLRRESFVSHVRLVHRIQCSWRHMEESTLRRDLLSALRGEYDLGAVIPQNLELSDLMPKPLSSELRSKTVDFGITTMSVFLTLVPRLDVGEQTWLREELIHSASSAAASAASFIRQLADIMFSPDADGRRRSVQCRRQLERFAMTSLSQQESKSLSNVRFLKETFESLNDWLISLEATHEQHMNAAEEEKDHFEELMNARNDFWRLVIGPSNRSNKSSSFSHEPMNICWARLLTQIREWFESKKEKAHLKKASSAWIHFENVAKRFDSALKRPVWDKILNGKQGMILPPASSSSFSLPRWEMEGHPRPPTDFIAMKGLRQLQELCDLEFGCSFRNVLASSSSPETSSPEQPQTVKLRGHEWRRNALSALCALRFAGSGGGVGALDAPQQNESRKAQISSLRDAAIRAVNASIASSEANIVSDDDPTLSTAAAVMPQKEEFPQVRPLSERAMALMELELCGRVSAIADGMDHDLVADDETLLQLAKARSQAQEIIEFGLLTNCKSCTHLAPYQEFVWSTENFITSKDLLSKDGDESKKKDSIQRIRSMCKVLLHELIISSSILRWNGLASKYHEFDSSVLLGRNGGLEQAQQQQQERRRGNMMRQAMFNNREWTKCDSLLEQNTLTMFVHAMIRGSGLGVDINAPKPESVSTIISVSQPTSLKERELKTSQLEEAVRCLKQFQQTPVAILEWDMFKLAFAATKSIMLSVDHALDKRKAEENVVLETAFHRCEQILNQPPQQDSLALGQAWTLLGLVRYVSFAPTSELDPQCEPRVIVDLLSRRRVVLENSLCALKLNRYWSVGDSTGSSFSNAAIYELAKQLEAVSKEISLLESRGIAIDREQDFEKCFAEISTYLKTVGHPNRVLALVDASGNDIEAFLNVCSGFCSRLCTQYMTCCDVVEPFVAAVYQTMHGLKLIHMNLHRRRSLSSSLKNETLLMKLFAWPRCNDSGTDMALSTSSTVMLSASAANLGPKFNTKLVLAALPSTELIRRESTRKYLSQSEHSRLRDAFIALSAQWRADRREEERKRQEREASVKLKKKKTNLDDKAEADSALLDPKEEADFKSMFPDFHSEFAQGPLTVDNEFGDQLSIEHEDDAENPPGQDVTIEENDASSYQALNFDQVETLVDSFVSLYSGGDCGKRNNMVPASSQMSDDAVRMLSFTSSYDAANELVSKVGFYGGPEVDQALLAANLFSLKSCISDLKM